MSAFTISPWMQKELNRLSPSDRKTRLTTMKKAHARRKEIAMKKDKDRAQKIIKTAKAKQTAGQRKKVKHK